MENRVKRVKYAPLTRRKVLDETTGEYASLQFTMRMNYPRICVYTKNLPRKFESEYKKEEVIDWNTIIIAPFKTDMFMNLLEDIEEAINSKESVKYITECLNVKWVNGEKTKDIYTQASVTVGKDDKGVVYIAVTEDKKRKVKFDLLPDNVWFRKKDTNGDLVTDLGKLSVKYSKAYLRMIRVLFEDELKEYGKIIQYQDKVGHSNDVKKQGNVKDDETSVDSDLESIL